MPTPHPAPLPKGIAVKQYVGGDAATIKAPGITIDVEGDRDDAETLVRTIAAVARGPLLEFVQWVQSDKYDSRELFARAAAAKALL